MNNRQILENALKQRGVKVQPLIVVSLLAACLPYADKITEITDEGEDTDALHNYWISLKPEFIDSETECGSIHEFNVADCKMHLKWIVPDPNFKKEAAK